MWISFPHFIHKKRGMYHVDISARYILHTIFTVEDLQWSFPHKMWISFPHFIHTIGLIYRLDISARYILHTIFTVEDLQRSFPHKMWISFPHYPHLSCIIYRGDILYKIFFSRFPHSRRSSMNLSTQNVDKFSTFYPQDRPHIAAQYIEPICVTELSTEGVDNLSTLSTFCPQQNALI